MHRFGFALAAAQHLVQRQRRRYLLQPSSGQAGGGDAQQAFDGGIERLHAAGGVDRGHALVEIGQHRVQVVAPARLDALQAGDFDGVLDARGHRSQRIHQHAGHSHALGIVDDQARTDQDLDAFVLELLGLGQRVVLVAVGAHQDVDGEGLHEGLQFRVLRVLAQQGHARRDPARRGQRVHDLETADLDLHHRHRDVAAQIAAVQAGRHHHVDAALARGLVDDAGGGVETGFDQLEFAALGVTGQDLGEGAGDARHAHGPDARQRRQVGFHGCRDSQHGGIGSEGRSGDFIIAMAAFQL